MARIAGHIVSIFKLSDEERREFAALVVCLEPGPDGKPCCCPAVFCPTHGSEKSFCELYGSDSPPTNEERERGKGAYKRIKDSFNKLGG